MLALLVGILKMSIGVAIVGTIVVVAGVSLYRNRRLLFWCITAVLVGHMAIAGIVYTAGILLAKPQPVVPPPPYITIRPQQKQVEPPKPKEADTLPDAKLGSPKSHSKSTQMPRGTEIKPKQPGASKPKDPTKAKNPKVIDTKGDIPVDPDLLTGLYQGIKVTDVGPFSATGPGTGGKSGTKGGNDDDDVPPGQLWGKPNGKDPEGRVYFIRLKHGNGAWNMYDDGTKRLLSYLSQQSFRCETETRAKTAPEIRDAYLKKNMTPAFLYIYCDDTFKLSGSDVAVLHDYLGQGGFLFIDSSPDPYIKARVARELDKILPGAPLSAISPRHPINSFLFRLSNPGVGMNTVDYTNYGITRKGRLVVFYTMGNFGQIYSLYSPTQGEYFTAQYQMGANVMVYAIRQGDPTDIKQQAGAKATITKSTLEKMGLLPTSTPTKPAAGGPADSVKIKKPVKLDKNGKPIPQTSNDPEEIKLLDQ